MIKVNNLVKRYGDFTALHGITFEAAEGEILGFLGPNGAGKTTTMRILTGYMPPTAGEATIAGYDVFLDSLMVRRQIGYLPETVPLYPDMTVRGYVEFMAELRGIKQRRRRVMETLELVGMAGRSRSLIRNISKGMRQRVGLAQALVHDPPVLILDEPTIGLDPSQVADLRPFIRELGEHHTVMLSTHILAEAEQVCDRVVIIDQGHIIAQDTPDKLRERLQIGVRVFVRAQGRIRVEELAAMLAKVKGVQSAEPFQDGVIVSSASNKEVRPTLAAKILENGLELLELRPIAMTLEEIFLELTQQEKKEKTA